MDSTKQNLINLVENLRLAGLGHPDISCRGQDGLPCKCSICRHNATVNKIAKALTSRMKELTIFKKPDSAKEKVILARVEKQCGSCSKWHICPDAFKVWSDKCSLFVKG